MNRKIIGVTVGSSLPKPNFDQTDPRKGDYIRGDRAFITPDETLTQSGRPAEAKATGDAINLVQTNIDNLSEIVNNLDGTYYTEAEIDSMIDEVNAAIDAMPDANHDHNDLYYTKDEVIEAINNHSSDIDNPHSVTKEQIGLDKVDNTSDADKPISDATAMALEGKSDVGHDHNDLYYTETEIDDKLDVIQSEVDTKVDKDGDKVLSTNDYTTAEKDKLHDIEANANLYIHPTHTSHGSGLYKVAVDSEGHVSDATLVAKEDIVALGIPAQDTVYDDSNLKNRIESAENSIVDINEALDEASRQFEGYKTTNDYAVAENATNIETNKKDIKTIQDDYLTSAHEAQLQDGIKQVSDRVDENAKSIAVLNGEGEGSVKQSINNAFNEFATNVTNNDVIDTYIELINYAAEHGPEFANLVGVVDGIDKHVGEVENALDDYKEEVSEQFEEVESIINSHADNVENPHGVTKEQIGLSDVDNTSDMDKPVSNDMQEALDLKADVEHNHDDLYYDKEEILGLITVEDIDNICESIEGSDEVVDLLKVATSEWVQANYQPKGNYLTKIPDGYATEAFVENKIADVNTDVGNVNALQTVEKNLTGAVNEVLNAVDAVGSASAITLTAKGASDNFSNVYELKQGDNVIGNINILKDMVVQSGEVVDVDGVKNIKLVLQNIENPLYIPVGSLVDVYVAKAEAAQVQVTIDSNTREISASIIAGSVTSTELATNAVVTTKIADANVTKAKLSAEVLASLNKADVAEKNARDYADSLDDAMDVRMLAVETKLIDVSGRSSHEHENKEELDLIVSGDKAKWDNAVTDLADEIVRAKAAEDANATTIASAKIELQKKVASVNAGDSSVTVEGTATTPTVAVRLSQDDDNIIELAEDGLKVTAPATVEYTIEKTDGSTDYDAVYKFMKNGVQVGASINIPKNMVVKSGYVEDGNIVLILNDETDTQIVIPADSLITHITSGSTVADMVIINISDNYEVTATIANGSITTNELSLDIVDCLNDAHNHENADILASINEERVAAWDNASIELDSSLTVEGMAADAKAVGDAISTLSTNIAEAGAIDIDLDDSNSGEVNTINADTLGGYAADEYIKNTDIINADTLGNIPAEEYARKDDLSEYVKTTDLENLDTSGISMELLWENASPTSEFAAQSIALSNLSGYKMICISAKYHKNNYPLLSVMGKNDVGISYEPQYYNSAGDFYYRKFTIANNAISVGGGFKNTSANNEAIIPFQIYGIKGVSE